MGQLGTGVKTIIAGRCRFVEKRVLGGVYFVVGLVCAMMAVFAALPALDPK